jgi:hypothetical protein
MVFLWFAGEKELIREGGKREKEKKRKRDYKKLVHGL